MLPDFNRPEEFNRLLIYLMDRGGDLSVDSMTEMLSSSVFYGILPDHQSSIEAALLGGLVRLKSGRLKTTKVGMRFLALNPELRYELSPGQARFIYINLVHREPFLSVTRSFFSLFRPRGLERESSLELTAVEISTEQTIVLSLLRRLGVISLTKGIATVSKEYLPYASATRARRIITIQELEQLLAERAAQGEAAEEVVLQFERKRLLAAGHSLEAHAVRRVSGYDVRAGYDIESFEGNSISLAPDRFIEVKSTISDEGVFFWSSNERATAEELGDRYWICHLRGFSTENQESYSHVWIRNPADKANTGALALECSQFKVTFDVDTEAEAT